MRLQDDPRQKFTVIWNTYDAELQAACAIARQQKQRQLQAIVDLAVGLQARVLDLLPSIQFAKDLIIAGRGKNHGTLLCGNCRRVILERGQLIRQRDAADTGIDPVDRAHEVTGMEQRRHAGAAPRVGAAIAGNHGEKHRLFAQRGNICRKNGNARMIYGEHQFSEPEASHLKALAKEAISSKSTIYQLKNDLEKARQDAHAWKSRYEKIKVQFDTLKEQVKGYLAALERAPERVMTFIDRVLRTAPEQIELERNGAVEQPQKHKNRSGNRMSDNPVMSWEKRIFPDGGIRNGLCIVWASPIQKSGHFLR